jgi:hypothetical protein
MLLINKYMSDRYLQIMYLNILTHWVALHPDASYFSILLDLTQDDFTRQGRALVLNGLIVKNFELWNCITQIKIFNYYIISTLFVEFCLTYTY